MTAETGKRLAHYRLGSKLGAGGMGEVWEAEDTKLGRHVAVKVLPPAFAADPDRLARFEREAKLLAALNHPNIAAIYGVEEADGVRFLVLEMVPGETLAERLAQGPLPPEESLAVARQIAEALEAAHGQGILHRDLKPANVKVTPDDRVKVLDFGLAKTMGPDPSSSTTSLSPTVTVGGTELGVILGTAPYMSPEQARGKAVDRRADVWAFGCILYECLTGRPAYAGETVTDILGAIVHREPDWSLLPPATPPRAARLLRRCLQQDPRQRLHDIADARIVLEEGEVGEPHAAAAAPRPARRLAVVLAAVTLAGLAFLAGRWLAPGAAGAGPAPPVRFRVDASGLSGSPEDGQSLQGPALAISRDGRLLAYVRRGPGESPALHLRAMDQVAPERMQGTDGAEFPFFSPDGGWIGFFAEGRLRAIPTAGGSVLDLALAPNPRGGVWGDGVIYFTPTPDAGIWQVAAGGGTAEPLSVPDPEKGERTHRWPSLLPGGKALLVTVGNSRIRSFDDAAIAVLSLDTGELRTLFEGGSDGCYSPTGHIVYYRAGSLFTVPFDAETIRVTGPERVQGGVTGHPLTGGAQYGLSGGGVLVFVPGEPISDSRDLVLVGMDGSMTPMSRHRGEFTQISASPDGSSVALVRDGANSDIWVLELERDALTRLTFEWNNYDPVWSPDGTRVAFGQAQGGKSVLLWVPVDGSGPAETLYSSDQFVSPSSFSRDGAWLAFQGAGAETGLDLWVLSMKDRTAAPFLETPFGEEDPVFSPDGGWIAYSSDESGRPEIYVRPFPGPGGKWQVSVDGGRLPLFSADGKTIYFLGDEGSMAAEVDLTAGFRTGPPRAFLHVTGLAGGDLLPGRGVVGIRLAAPRSSPTEIEVVLGWTPAAAARGGG